MLLQRKICKSQRTGDCSQIWNKTRDSLFVPILTWMLFETWSRLRFGLRRLSQNRVCCWVGTVACLGNFIIYSWEIISQRFSGKEDFEKKTCEKLTPCLCKHGGHVIYNRLEKLIFGSFLKTSKKKNLKDKNKFTQKSFFFFLFWEVSLNFLLTTQRFRRDVSGRSLSPTVQR